MRIFKTKNFNKWATKLNISNEVLVKAVHEILGGQAEANYGSGLFKKRIAIGSKGKSAGVRTLIAVKTEANAFYLYGFAKNERGNITIPEEKAYKILAKEFSKYSDEDLNNYIKKGLLIEIGEQNG